MDMAEVIKAIHIVLKPSARCVIVIGNSAYGGVIVPTDAILAVIAERVGFRVEKLAVARSLTTSSQQRHHLNGRDEFLRESILILSKRDPRLEDKPLEVVDEIPTTDSERYNKVFLIRNNGLTAGTHKFHRYPGKFIPHVPRWALNRYGTADSCVVDPFCGSGTTLVEAANFGASSYGLDIDPIARLVSTVKTTPISAGKLLKLKTDIATRINRKRRAEFRPEIPTLAHWFSEEAIQSLGIIRDVIEEYRIDAASYRFLIVCFASIIRRASNADNQTQKTYVSHTKIKRPEHAITLFHKAVDDYSSRLSSLSRSGSAKIIHASSALDFGDYWERKRLPQADLIITSPPYLNSVDYVYNQMAEYFWIGDLYGMETQALQNEYKRNYVGTTSVGRDVYAEGLSTGFPDVDAVAGRIFRKSKKNGYVVAKYFTDMRKHFSQAAKVVTEGGHYVMVVGDSQVSGEPVAVSDLLLGVASAEGFHFAGRFGYEIRNRHMRFPRMGRGGILRYDWVIELVRSPSHV